MKSRSQSICGRRAPVLLASVCLALVAVPAQATVISGSSDAFDISADLSVQILGVTTDAEAGPLAPASGTAPPPYDETNTLVEAEAEATVGLLEVLTFSADLLQNNAASDVDTGPGDRFASADALIQGAELSLFEAAFGTGDVITSNATVSGDFNDFTTAGGTELVNVEVVGPGVEVEAETIPDPNTVLLDLLGITVTLNQQIEGGDGVSSRSLEVNAIHIGFDGVTAPLLDLDPTVTVDGEIIIGHSFAELTAEPPVAVTGPGMLTLTGLGLMVLVGLTRLRMPRHRQHQF